jgi:hypothetical protein
MNDTHFSPQEAAELLDQTTRQARREFTHRRPVLNVIQAITMLVGFGAIWQSVRGQHPYQGPSWAAIAITYALVALVIGTAAKLMREASAGVSGPAEDRSKMMLTIQAAAWAVPYVTLAILADSGVSHAFVFGQFLAAAPFIFVGGIYAITSAMQGNQGAFRIGLVIVVIAAVAMCTGPVAVWLVMGVGLGLTFLVRAVLTARQLRA